MQPEGGPCRQLSEARAGCRAALQALRKGCWEAAVTPGCHPASRHPGSCMSLRGTGATEGTLAEEDSPPSFCSLGPSMPPATPSRSLFSAAP